MAASYGQAPLAAGEARRLIREAVLRGAVAYSDHVLRRIAMRRVPRKELLRVLRTGAIIDRSKGNHGWRYTVQGRALDGRTLEVVVELHPATPRVVVITAWRN